VEGNTQEESPEAAVCVGNGHTPAVGWMTGDAIGSPLVVRL
jgi:hypothetical protein